MLKSLFPDICSTALSESRDFYTNLFGMKAVFDIEWYIQMQSEHDENVQIAFVDKSHSSVPSGYGLDPKGVVVTLEYDEVDDVYQRAVDLGLPVIVELQDEEYGQRHFMVEDPNGLLVDVVKTIEPSQEFIEKYL